MKNPNVAEKTPHSKSLTLNAIGAAALAGAAYLIGVASAPIVEMIPRIEVQPNVAMMAIAVLACLYVALRNAR